jgi:ABC-type transport system involved in cytochrome c biogenesis permease subunit
MTIDTIATALIILTVFVYLFVGIFSVKKSVYAVPVFVFAWLINFAVFMINWIAGKEPPFGNMYHVMVFLALCMLPLYYYLAKREGLAWLKSYFVFASVIPMIGAFFMKREVVWKRMPALQSGWFVPHVFSYILSYLLQPLQ